MNKKYFFYNINLLNFYAFILGYKNKNIGTWTLMQVAEDPGTGKLTTDNSTFPPCIWLLRGFCLELYPYCLFRGHGIVFFVLTKTFQPREWSRACVWGVAPETTPEAEKSRFE